MCKGSLVPGKNTTFGKGNSGSMPEKLSSVGFDDRKFTSSWESPLDLLEGLHQSLPAIKPVINENGAPEERRFQGKGRLEVDQDFYQ